MKRVDTMRRFIGYLALLGIGLCVPDGPSSNSLPLRNPLLNYSPYYNPGSATAPILSYSNTHGVDGSYSYSFTTGDGKQAQENGYLKDAYIDNIGQPQGTQVKEGSYSYVSPEGTPIQIDYVADENGFRHGGVHFTANGKGAIPASLLLALAAAAVAADVSDLQPSYLQQQYHTTEPIPIVRQEQIINPDGSYKW
ncbi:cuticular protein RR-1 motif 45 precursor, partial [Danaus plexippus plexippus]